MSVRIGIIGIGQQGSMYASVMKNGKFMGMDVGKVKGAELTGICDIREERREWAKENLGEDIKIYEDYIEMLDSGEIDVVMVVVPHYLHPEMAIEAMNRDIHVIVDKPAGVYTKQVKEMNEVAASKPNVKFGMMFNQRMNPLYQKLKEIMDSGVIGELRRTNWMITTWWRPQAYYDMSSWRATWEGEGGGVLINQAPHQIDLWQWLCGMPKKVNAKISYGSHRDIVVDDDVTAVVEYENGATGVFITCTHDIMGTDRFEIFGDKGKVIVENSKKIILKTLKESENKLNEKLTFEDVKAIFTGQGLKDVMEEEVIEVESAWGRQHAEVIEAFVASIENGTPLAANGEEGINALTITNAMHLSSWLGKEVELPLDEDLFFEELQKRIDEERREKEETITS
ncbi:Gfo/Idh/MocA family oxidoreductase [Clostridium sediminicola]|uniref:Gfo/Idh/MocA family protein n=1 Tax=Clostridium sediminicola TaxID=3114879 RepID=UPI0031F27607